MFHRLNSIVGIEKYVVGENDVFAICNNKTIKIEELTLFPFNSYSGFNPIFLTYKSSVFYSNYEGELFEYNNDTKEVTKNKKYSAALNSNHNNIFVITNVLGTKIIDIEKKTTIKELPDVRLTRVVTSSQFIVGKLGRKGKEIIVIDIKNNTNFNIPLISKLNQIVNIKDELVLLFYADKTISCFDLITKEEVWSKQILDGIPNRVILEDLFVELLHDKEINKIYLLAQNYFFEIDKRGKESILIKDYNQKSDLEWYFKDSRLYGNLITFSGANTLGMFPMVAGVIDKNTKEILWTVKSKPGVYFEEAPQIKGNKLYILDSTKTLHIYKKESLPSNSSI